MHKLGNYANYTLICCWQTETWWW